ncbi:hypothetical protein EAG_13421 [Camponotus floridanus]|uniref:Uncharacterized protein n=1 Tax=Camponotus floridanus TaxID=104421 RepID=E2A250_CAMFO|nr:hypothetical protein EAG_13421 [Camponotus floridanus]
MVHRAKAKPAKSTQAFLLSPQPPSFDTPPPSPFFGLLASPLPRPKIARSADVIDLSSSSPRTKLSPEPAGVDERPAASPTGQVLTATADETVTVTFNIVTRGTQFPRSPSILTRRIKIDENRDPARIVLVRRALQASSQNLLNIPEER